MKSNNWYRIADVIADALLWVIIVAILSIFLWLLVVVVTGT